MRILLTGGAGFIGSLIAQAYRNRGDHVVIVDSLVTGTATQVPVGATFIEQDIRDPDLVRTVIDHGPFDLVSHHAALKDVRKALLDPRADADANILGMINVLRAAAEGGAGRLVFASSAAVYGDAAVFPTPEAVECIPISPYGISKMTGELYGRYFALNRDLPVIALRYGTVYGTFTPAASEAGVITIFTRRLLSGEVPVIYGDGLQTRDFVNVEDIVRANILVGAAPMQSPWAVYNVSTGTETSVRDLARTLISLAGATCTPRYEAAKAGEIRRNVQDASRLREAVGWAPEIQLDQGLAAVVEATRHASRG
ncbi:MAG: NAD-dependent epimerase/dehydratase family protein [Chloroflexi bacterium]|nr:NAD-dependent epimerase/dehydratase family protein [Chloroflexota bacterium]